MEIADEPQTSRSGMTRSTSNYLMLNNATPGDTSRDLDETASFSDTDSQAPPAPLFYILPYRKAYYAIPMLALLDLGCAIALAVFTARLHPQGVISLLIWHFVRPLVIFQSGLSWRIREKGFVTLLTCLVGRHPLIIISNLAHIIKQISLLLILWHVNVLVQRFKLYPKASHRILPALLVSHLFFATAHWLLFVALIGIRRDANPFGIGSLVINRADFVAPVAEGIYFDEDETEPPSRLLEPDDLDFDSDGISESSSEADPDDIIDMPKSTSVRSSLANYLIKGDGKTARHRSSRGTLRNRASFTQP